MTTAVQLKAPALQRGRPLKFTPEMRGQISNLVERGKSCDEIAEIIGVTTATLQVTCSKLGISLRRPTLLGAIMDQICKAGSAIRYARLGYGYIKSIVAIIDLVLIISASVLGGALYQSVSYQNIGEIQVLLGVGIADGINFTLLANLLRAYHLPVLLAPAHYLLRVLGTWLFVFLIFILVLFLLKVGAAYSRGSMTSCAVLGAVFLGGWRLAVGKYLRSALASGAVSGRRAVIVGGRDEVSSLYPSDLLLSYGVTEVGRITVADGQDVNSAGAELRELDNIAELVRQTEAEEVVVALRWNSANLLALVRGRLRASPVPVRLLPDRFIKSLLGETAAFTCASLVIELQRAPLSRMELAVKRAIDLIIAIPAIVILMPILTLIAVAIKFDSPGPVIFRQRRSGFNGQQFVIFKFRTMTVLEDDAQIPQARRHDPRVTKLGHVLRRTSIDEFPQLLNVVKGDMSLVGPRPHALAHDNEYSNLIASYANRHHVKPGITGWAQINGFRGETRGLDQMVERVKLDLWYLNNWSLWLDLWIIVRTCFEVLRGRSAY